MAPETFARYFSQVELISAAVSPKKEASDKIDNLEKKLESHVQVRHASDSIERNMRIAPKPGEIANKLRYPILYSQALKSVVEGLETKDGIRTKETDLLKRRIDRLE